MPTTITITLPDDVARGLAATAQRHGITAETAVIEAITDRLDAAVRYKAAIARIETLDQAITELAQFLGEATAASGGELDLSKICKATCVGAKP